MTESLLALTIFRDDFDILFLLMFGFLLFVKYFHWLASDRIEWVRYSPPCHLDPSTSSCFVADGSASLSWTTTIVSSSGDYFVHYVFGLLIYSCSHSPSRAQGCWWDDDLCERSRFGLILQRISYQEAHNLAHHHFGDTTGDRNFRTGVGCPSSQP